MSIDKININRETDKKPGAAAQAGAVLIGLIITMVILSALGAAMLYQTSTQDYEQPLANGYFQSCYLAESGYRYAGAKMKHGISDLDNINKKDFSMGGGKGFKLVLKPYVFTVASGDGTDTLEVDIPFGTVPQLPDVPGAVKIGDEASQAFDTIIIPDLDGKIIRFRKDSGTWTAPTGKRAWLVLANNGYTNPPSGPGAGGDLGLLASADLFPLKNGRFEAGGVFYKYRERETGQLASISMADSSSPWVAPPPSGDVVLRDFLRLDSEGFAGTGGMKTEKKIVYYIPLSEKSWTQFYDLFEDKSHFESASTLGSHGIQVMGGDKALKVTGTEAGPAGSTAALIKLDWNTTNVKFNRIHLWTGNFLSYNAQVKTGFDSSIIPSYGFDPSPVPKYFAAGISFRMDNNDNFYGLSFLRGNNGLASPGDGISDDLVPMDDQALLVLWEQTNSGASKKWLAYKKLPPVVLFTDDTESGEGGWTRDAPWALVSTDSHSGSTSWHDSPGGDYENNENISLVSPSMDLTGMRDVYLKFWHKYSMEAGYDFGYVEISKDGGLTWVSTPLASYTNWTILSVEFSQDTWKEERIAIPASLLTNKVKIRFRLVTDILWKYDGWYIDDIKVESEFNYPLNEAAMVVSLDDAASIEFTNGDSIPIKKGDMVKQDNGAYGIVSEEPILSGGAWGTDAHGLLLLNNISTVSFITAPLKVNGTRLADAVPAFRTKDNYIRAYIADTSGYGTADADPFNIERLAYPRCSSGCTSLKWPPEKISDAVSSNDYFILVQWDQINPAATDVEKISSIDEPDVILRGSALDLLTPSSAGYTRPELGLHAYGIGALNVYYDDFGVQTYSPTPKGFLSAVQE